MKNSILLIALFIISSAQGQEAVIGGKVGWLPIINSTTYALDTAIHLGTSAKLGVMQSSSDLKSVYIGTAFGSPGNTYSLIQLDGNTHAIQNQLAVDAITVDLQITSDNQFLFWDVSKIVGGIAKNVVYKVNSSSMTIVDSLSGIGNIQSLKIIDNNSFYFGTVGSVSGYQLYTASFATHSLIDSISLMSNMDRFVVNDANTMIYGISSIPAALFEIDLVAKTVDTTLIPGVNGSLYDVILNNDNTKLYMVSSGNSIAVPGFARVLNTSDLTTLTEIEIGYGLGDVKFSPSGDLWCLQGHGLSISIIDTNTNSVTYTFTDNSVVPQYITFAAGPGTPNSTTDLTKTPSFSFYPNPVSDHLNIEFGNEHNFQKVAILNTTGTVLFHKEIQNMTTCLINVGQFPAGVYFIQGTDKNNLKINYKFLKL